VNGTASARRNHAGASSARTPGGDTGSAERGAAPDADERGSAALIAATVGWRNMPSQVPVRI
jgi:hypothetical protein